MESDIGYRNIKNTYKVQSKIDKITFTTVKWAKLRDTIEIFAVKKILKKKMSDEGRIMMRTEMEILNKIEHPNIVKLNEVFEDDQYWCLVMELMKSGQLFHKFQ